jgi:hypothetical protein
MFKICLPPSASHFLYTTWFSKLLVISSFEIVVDQNLIDALDVSLAAFGRKEIEIAEVRYFCFHFLLLKHIANFQNEMPGLIYMRKKVR